MAATRTFAGITYTNGNCPPALLAELQPYGKHGNSGAAHAFLRRDAAESWNRAIADVERRTGIKLLVRGWNRSEAEQIEFYLERHRLARPGERACCTWQGRRYVFTGTAHAAPPGTSNHGWALAVDVIDFGAVGQWNHPRRVKAFPILAEHGWTETEARGRIQEPWHLVYDPAKDKHRGEKTAAAAPAANTPTVQEEDDEMKKVIEFHVPGKAKVNAEWWGLWIPSAGGYLRYSTEGDLKSASNQYRKLGYEVLTREQAGWDTNQVGTPAFIGTHLNKEG